MPLQATSGAASYDAFGGGVPVEPVYIEQIFSTYLYTGNGNTAPETQTINNGIDLSTKGGLVWIKNRTVATNNVLFDTNRGATKVLVSNATSAEATDASTLTSFNNNGFSVYYGQGVNGQNNPIASWTFRKQPKFFDVVTWTADDSGTGQAVPHNLGSIPGCIIVKATSASSNWFTWHIASGITVARSGFQLNSTAASALSVNSTGQMTSTEFFSGQLFDSSFGRPVTDGTTYVAYLFAHNAGGFGLTGTDNVISCGSYTSDGSGNATVTLGYEPQWVMIKKSSGVGTWYMFDTMRGYVNPGPSNQLAANTSGAEVSAGNIGYPTATGFQVSGLGSSADFIYIAIRRGPMKVPTSGTSVFAPVIRTGTSTAVSVTGVGFPPDMMWSQYRDSAGNDNPLYDKLRGPTRTLFKNSTMAEQTPASYGINSFDQDGVSLAANQGYTNNSGSLFIYDFFRRAPSFFDEVCDSLSGTVNHNLGVAPELIIAKVRNYSPQDWFVDVPSLGATRTLNLNLTGAASSTNYISSPTATQFTTTLGGGGYNYVYYLFASCAGVSKVGSYTGNGSSQTINCGFTGGARFVLIKKSSGTGDWMVSDSARGIVSGNDPYLELNNTNAEVTGEDWLDTDSTGFVVNEVSGSNANTNGATYIFLAIA
jgi:hypothetical protein